MASVDVGDNSYDAFSDVDFADEFLGGDIARAVSWSILNDDSKGRALVSATRMLLALPWCDETPNPAGEVDPVIQEVNAMLAADLAAKPKLFANATGDSNIKVAKAGSAQVEFFSPVTGGPPIPLMLWNRLVNAGLVCLSKIDGDTVNDGAIVTGISGGCRPLGGRLPWDWPIAAVDFD